MATAFCRLRSRPSGNSLATTSPPRRLNQPTETTDLWRLLIARRRPVQVYEVDAWGAPWIRCRVAKTGGGCEQHFLAITHGGLVLVTAAEALGRPTDLANKV